MAGKREEGDREEESGSCGGGDGVIWGDGEGAAPPQASSSAHITLPNCHCPLRHLPPLHTPNHPPSPALPPSILDRMINGVSVHASATVPVYTKHYHNFFFFFFLL